MVESTLFLLLCLGSYFLGRAEKVYLLDTLNATSELDWKAYSNLDEKEGWLEETYRSETENVNHQAYSTCNIEHDKIENWLLLPKVERRNANRIYVETKFTMRKCAELPSMKKTCKETLRLYAVQLSANEHLPHKWYETNDTKWELVDTIAPNTESSAVYIQTSSFAVNGSSVHFALKDSGACASILYVKIYYVLCAEATNAFVSLPRTLTGKEVHSVVTVYGKCVENAATSNPLQSNPTAICKADGSWQTIGSTACECNAGFIPSISSNTCTACSVGTYKARRGFDECRPCPRHSNSLATGSAECKCDAGYFRSKNDSADSPCSQPPSKPSAVRIVAVNQTSVTLNWQEPSSLGGRKEIWYSYKCPQCPPTTTAQPARKNFEEQYLILSNLEPGARYTLMIFALNDVSQQSDLKQYEVVEFKTEDSDNMVIDQLRVDAEVDNGVILAWSSLPGVTDYEVEKWQHNDTSSVRSQQPYYNFGNLNKLYIYGFRVRAWSNRKGVSNWSEPLFYQLGTGAVAKDVALRAGLLVGRTVVGTSEIQNGSFWKNDGLYQWIFVALFVVVCIFAVFLLYGRLTSHKRMNDMDPLNYNKEPFTPDYGPSSTLPSFLKKFNGPLMPSYGGTHRDNALSTTSTHKEYVDPSTYKDIKLAVDEFANEIPDQYLELTSRLGSGEFGEVFYGRLRYPDGYGMAYEKLVAVKTLHIKHDQSAEKARNDFLSEAARMGQFSNANVVQLIGVITRKEPVMIITEYMLNGSLDTYLKEKKGQISIKQLVQMIHGISSGMKYLHAMNYVHRDLAARNVLVDDKLTCKIADFGLSRSLRREGCVENEYTTQGGKIPIRWTDPESISHQTYTKASDVWSFGIVMWECATFGDRPYWDWDNQTVIREVAAGYRLPFPPEVGNSSHFLYHIMLKCWQMDRTRRPSFVELESELDMYSTELEKLDCQVYESPIYVQDGCASGARTPCFFPPPPPSSAVPTLTLRQFLEHNNVIHCYENLTAYRINSVASLSQLSYQEMAMFGIRHEDAVRISAALSADSRNGNRLVSYPPPSNPSACPPVTLRRPHLPPLPPTPGGCSIGRGTQRSPLLSSSSVATTQTVLTASATPNGSCSAMTRRSLNLSGEEGFFV